MLTFQDVSRNILKRWEASLEIGGRHFGARLKNKLNLEEKHAVNFRQMQASYMIKLSQELSCSGPRFEIHFLMSHNIRHESHKSHQQIYTKEIVFGCRYRPKWISWYRGYFFFSTSTHEKETWIAKCVRCSSKLDANANHSLNLQLVTAPFRLLR
jgi:hypothetical protein